MSMIASRALNCACRQRISITQTNRASKNWGYPESSMLRAMSSAKSLSEARPSASILLISPTNEILLLHRVRTSSAFPSAHVFPGGILSAHQDGVIPDTNDPMRHEDGEAYRVGAIRECFEESGILLATKVAGEGRGHILEVEDTERERARREVHANKINFPAWVRAQGGVLDTDGLTPFTRWITPTNIPKRFTTQMYLYFLPLSNDKHATGSASDHDAMIPIPTSDGGLEHTAARFLPPKQWLDMARSGEIILFPPQFFLMYLLEPFLSAGSDYSGQSPTSKAILQSQRERILEFVKTSNPPWTEKCISPTQILRLEGDGRAVLGIDEPGAELSGSSRKGEMDHVILVEFNKEGPRRVEVAWRSEIFLQTREEKGNNVKL